MGCSTSVASAREDPKYCLQKASMVSSFALEEREKEEEEER